METDLIGMISGFRMVYYMYYKELKLVGNGLNVEEFITSSSSDDWRVKKEVAFSNGKITIEYLGFKASHSELILSYGKSSLEEVEVTNIIPLEKKQLTVEEYNQILNLFFEEVIKPYLKKKPDIEVVNFLMGRFDPLNYISKDALDRLKTFLESVDNRFPIINDMNEEKWYGFICQTLDDNLAFDYDTLFLFLQDDEYWGNGVALNENQAEFLAKEYSDCIRLLQYYKKTRKAD